MGLFGAGGIVSSWQGGGKGVIGLTDTSDRQPVRLCV